MPSLTFTVSVSAPIPFTPELPVYAIALALSIKLLRLINVPDSTKVLLSLPDTVTPPPLLPDKTPFATTIVTDKGSPLGSDKVAADKSMLVTVS